MFIPCLFALLGASRHVLMWYFHYTALYGDGEGTYSSSSCSIILSIL